MISLTQIIGSENVEEGIEVRAVKVVELTALSRGEMSRPSF